jgi:hypothetical protein
MTNVSHKRKQILATTPRAIKTIFFGVIETAPFNFFQIMYGMKAVRKSPAYFSVRTISFPKTATRRTKGKNRIASTNNTARIPLKNFVGSVTILIYVLLASPLVTTDPFVLIKDDHEDAQTIDPCGVGALATG